MTDATATADARPRATFHAMTEGTKEDWDRIAVGAIELAAGLPDRTLTHLRQLGGDFGGFAVDRLGQSLQTPPRAYRADHADVAAAIVKPFVSEQNHWMVEKHAIFQGYYFFHHLGLDRNLREQFRGHEWFDYTAEFCHEYDQPAFDPGYDTLPLEHFEPLVREVMSSPKRSIYLQQ